MKTMTVKEAKHEDFLRFGVEGNCYVVEFEDEHVAFCYARERANQIALACNAHEDLMKALDEIAELFTNCQLPAEVSAFKIAKLAIAKANKAKGE